MKKIADTPPDMFVVAPGVWGQKHVFVNYYMVHDAESSQWVLIDTGLYWSAKRIKHMAEHLFGANTKPAAIILTHGHFDHVGTVKQLAQEWDVPVYAHELEFPYLTGKSAYPPPDPTVGGGMMAWMAGIYPKQPINIWKHLRALPADGSVPVLKGWRYIHTPGHAPGQISLFREADGVLLAGDAFVTTNQESALSVMMQTKVLSGPPKYFTPDWQAAKASVDKLNDLHPQVVATGHGKPMSGKEMRDALQQLSNNFYKVAVPEHGRYVPYPAIANEHGVIYVPPSKDNHEVAWTAFGLTALATAGIIWGSYKKKKRKRHNEDLLEVEYNY